MRAPWRESADPYHCLVAAVMAQQTQMSRVLVHYERFMAAFPSIDALAGASLAQVIRVWKGMGYNARAVRLHRAARVIARDGWPRDARGLQQIEGVGPFTAAIIASFAFGEAVACVDTNVRRVLGRLAGNEDVSAAQMQDLAARVIATDAPARWNQAVMDFGAAICVPRPKCDVCPLARWCASRVRFRAERQQPDRPVRRRAAQPFEGSARWYRGRIMDVLRDLPPGASIALSSLPRLLRNGHGQPGSPEVRDLASALERDGLAVIARGRIALPA